MPIPSSRNTSAKIPGTKELALSEPAREEDDVFIPLESTVEALKKIIEKEEDAATFIRAPVAAGKTTLALYLAEKHKHEFVMVDLAVDEEGMRKNIAEAIKENVPDISNDSDFTEVLKAMARSKKTLILDEAHLIFSFPRLATQLFKLPAQWRNAPRLKILLFSAADEYKAEQNMSRLEMIKRYMWYPPMPDAKDLAERLMEAGVVLDEASVLFFLKLCSGHRGIFMKAMDWVQRKQENNTSWNIHDTVSFVKASFAKAKGQTKIGWSTGLRRSMIESRAVRVNVYFSDLLNIPAELIEAVFGGAKRKEFFGEHLRSLTIGGFLAPLRKTSNEEFVSLDWTNIGQRYGLANSLMAEYYNDVFSSVEPFYCTQKLISPCPSTAADLVARALPYMSFSTVVVGNPLPDREGVDKELSQTEKLKTPLSKSGLPLEDNYNQALVQVLSNLHYNVSTPLDTHGKIDVVVTYDEQKTCGLECIMASRSAHDHNEYAARFANAENSDYFKATLQGLIVIGLDRETVCNRVNETCVRAERLEVIGLVVSAAHDSYEMYVRPKSSSKELEGPFFFVCDFVAKQLKPAASFRGECVVAAVELQNSKKRKSTLD